MNSTTFKSNPVDAVTSTWIFGYGSLIWRPDFAYVERHDAMALGWARRFWQGSTDHRGVPGAPGRVVTLVPLSGAQCRGALYRIDDVDAKAIIDALDYREKGGYSRQILPVQYGNHGQTVEALTYVAHPDNPNYLGPASDEEIVAQILTSSGPSGDNPEYLIRLYEAFAEHGVDDDHITALYCHLQEQLDT